MLISIVAAVYLVIGFLHFFFSGDWLAMLADSRHGIPTWIVTSIIFCFIFLWPLCWLLLGVIVLTAKYSPKLFEQMDVRFENLCDKWKKNG